MVSKAAEETLGLDLITKKALESHDGKPGLPVYIAVGVVLCVLMRAWLCCVLSVCQCLCGCVG